MHPICAVGRTNFCNMVLIILSIIFAAIAAATSLIRYGISFAGFTRSGIARKDIVTASERAERSSASSHKWEAYRRRRFGRFSRRERRAYFDPYVRNEQRGKSAKAPSALRVGLKRVRLRRCSFVTYRSGYAPHSRLASRPF